MGSTVFFHNGFGDYVINRGALAVLAQHLPRPSRLIYGVGPQQFLVADLPFDLFQSITISAPAQGQGRLFNCPETPVGAWADILVNLASWEGAAFDEFRCQLNPKRYAWNSAWRRWDEDGPNAVQLSAETVKFLYPNVDLEALRSDITFSAKVTEAVKTLAQNAEMQGYTKRIGVHFDSSEDKAWPISTFSNVLCSVLDAHSEACVFVVGRNDQLKRCTCHAHRFQFLSGASLESSMCVIANCHVVFGVDSCMTKVADAAGVPSVAVFATERDISRWGNFWTTSANLLIPRDADASFTRTAAAYLEMALSSHILPP